MTTAVKNMAAIEKYDSWNKKYLTSSTMVLDLEMLFWRALNLLSFCHDKKLEPNEPESQGPNFL